MIDRKLIEQFPKIIKAQHQVNIELIYSKAILFPAQDSVPDTHTIYAGTTVSLHPRRTSDDPSSWSFHTTLSIHSSPI